MQRLRMASAASLDEMHRCWRRLVCEARRNGDTEREIKLNEVREWIRKGKATPRCEVCGVRISRVSHGPKRQIQTAQRCQLHANQKRFYPRALTALLIGLAMICQAFGQPPMPPVPAKPFTFSSRAAMTFATLPPPPPKVPIITNIVTAYFATNTPDAPWIEFVPATVGFFQSSFDGINWRIIRQFDYGQGGRFELATNVFKGRVQFYRAGYQ